jgi:hypothetical protein
MRYRPIDRDPDDPRLGRFIPDDFAHVETYPLTALPDEERPTQRPVVIGVNWYSEFDNPALDEETGEYFVARGGAGSLTKIRGGHCVCLEPGGEPDPDEWWDFYDQGAEGACVGFGWSRCMSILNQELYAARWLWDRSKEADEWPRIPATTTARRAGRLEASFRSPDTSTGATTAPTTTTPSVAVTNPPPTTASSDSAGRVRSTTSTRCSGMTGRMSLARCRF